MIWRLDKPERFLEQIRWTCDEDESGCWIWPSCKTWTREDSRPKLKINGKAMSTSRWVLWAVTGELQECARHKCDVGCCCNPNHLLWGTMLDNNRDKADRGRAKAPVGEAHGQAKLNTYTVQEIRQLHFEGTRTLDLSRMYEVSRATIDDVVNRRTWKHVN